VERLVLIDSWFPFGEVSVESIRERSAFTALPGMYAMHVWFARRPLVTSRSSILCSLLKNKDREKILQIMGIPPNENLLLAAEKIEEAKAKGIRKKENFRWIDCKTDRQKRQLSKIRWHLQN